MLPVDRELQIHGKTRTSLKHFKHYKNAMIVCAIPIALCTCNPQAMVSKMANMLLGFSYSAVILIQYTYLLN